MTLSYFYVLQSVILINNTLIINKTGLIIVMYYNVAAIRQKYYCNKFVCDADVTLYERLARQGSV